MHIYHVIEPAECARVRSRVHDMRSRWIPRAPVPFFTLGAATYMDVVGGQRDRYLALAAAENPHLAEHFGWLHERVIGLLARVLGEEVSLAPGFALPGFHIFLAHPAFLQPLASVHLDLQYRQHSWEQLGQPDFDRPISFTLSVALPAAGSGLLVWPQAPGAPRLAESGYVQALTDRQRPGYVPYTPGSMVVHDGHLVHQIAPLTRLIPGDERITLQGHALRCGPRWYVYW